MSNERDHARPLLKTVDNALEELLTLVFAYINDPRNEYKHLKIEWDEILDKYDINYNNKERWSVK